MGTGSNTELSLSDKSALCSLRSGSGCRLITLKSTDLKFCGEFTTEWSRHNIYLYSYGVHTGSDHDKSLISNWKDAIMGIQIPLRLRIWGAFFGCKDSSLHRGRGKRCYVQNMGLKIEPKAYFLSAKLSYLK
jgi:hypothetical protein